MQRTLLMARGKREKETKIAFQMLLKKKAELAKRSSEEDPVDNDLEELERELVLSEIALAVHKVFGEIRLVQQELDMLQQIAVMRAKGVDVMAKPKPSKKKPNPPFTIYKDQKGELRSQVFRPHWIQPTVSIEEAGMIDYQHAVRGGGAESAKKDSSGEEEDPDDDDVWRKKREWDQWCDDNPRGSGNKMGNMG